jgi:hypothetical protein
MFTFEHYEIGHVYGTHRLPIDAGLESRWLRTFPQDPWTAEAVAPGMLSVITLLAYTNVIAPRPPGNIHGGQRFDIVRLPRRGDVLDTTVRCEDKQVRKERKLVYLAFETRDAMRDLVFRGIFTSIVAQ